jgi:hypothetical protein
MKSDPLGSAEVRQDGQRPALEVCKNKTAGRLRGRPAVHTVIFIVPAVWEFADSHPVAADAPPRA